MSMECVTIRPAVDGDGNPKVTTQGTQVVLPSGECLPRVVGIEINGSVDDVWLATIHCHARLDANGIKASPVYYKGKVTLWQRLCARLGGLDLDVTTLDSVAREFWDGRAR